MTVPLGDAPPPLPTLFVVGAAKAGTTTLHHALRAHPGLVVPPHEEPSYFAFDGVRPTYRGPGGTEAAINRMAVVDEAAYRELYAAAGPSRPGVDVSPAYLCVPGTAQRIASAVPDAHVVIVLRHPVDRAYSAFMHARRDGREPIADFEQALAEEPRRCAEHWGMLWRYAELGRYAPQVEEYLAAFPRERVLIRRFEDLTADVPAFVNDLLAAAGLPPAPAGTADRRHNVSGLPRNRMVHRLTSPEGPLRRVGLAAAGVLGTERVHGWRRRLRTRNLDRVPLADDVRARLTERFRDDITRTAAVTGLDLAAWLA